VDRFVDELKRGSMLLGAGCQGGPDSFAPSLSAFAPCALCDLSINDDKPNRLLRGIVGWLDAFLLHKCEVEAAVFSKTLGHRPRFGTSWRSLGDGQQLVSGSFH